MPVDVIAGDDDTFEVLYRDEHVVAINKPSGLLVHRSPIDRHETRFAVQLVRDQIGQYVYPVHRLDKPTSGVLLFGLSTDAARHLSEQFSTGRVHKRYLAVVRGHCPLAGRIDHPLTRELDPIADRPRLNKPDSELLPQAAVTHFSRLAQVEIPFAVERYPQTRYSLVMLRPETGRKHQLRRHLKHLGYPIIGDAKHGKGVHNRFFRSQYDCHRLLLACTALVFTHPVSGQGVALHAGLDSAFERVLAAFEWSDSLPRSGQAMLDEFAENYQGQTQNASQGE